MKQFDDMMPSADPAELDAILRDVKVETHRPNYDGHDIPEASVTMMALGVDERLAPHMPDIVDGQVFEYDPSGRIPTARDVGMRRLPGNASIVEVDEGEYHVNFLVNPRSPANIARTQITLTGMLGRSTSEVLVNGGMPADFEQRDRPDPLEPGEYRTVGEVAWDVVDAGLVALNAQKQEVMSVVAAGVAAGVLMTGVPAVGSSVMARPPAVSTPAPQKGPQPQEGPNEVKQVEQAKVKLTAAERVIPTEETKAVYVPQRPTHLRAVAIALNTKTSVLAAANPHLDPKAEIPAGTEIVGMVKASRVSLDKPASIGAVARAFGLTDDAVRSVNTLDDDGRVSGEIKIPRALLKLDDQTRPNIGAIKRGLQLTETQARNLHFANNHAPAGLLVLPAGSNLADEEAVGLLVSVAQSPAEQIDSPANTTGPVDIGPELGDPQFLPIEEVAGGLQSDTTTTTPDSAATASEVLTEPASEADVIEPTETTTTTPETTTTTILAGEVPTDTPEVAADSVPDQAAIGSPPPAGEVTAPAEPAPIEPTPAETVPAPAAPEQKLYRPALPEEKFAAEQAALKNALDVAIQTGDMGPLNHLITFSPIFKAYDLPADLQAQGFRYLPDAAALNIPGLVYEYSPDTPSKERVANSNVIALNLLAAYSFRVEIEANPLYKAAFGSSCIRFGDLAAHLGHQSHNGAQSDLTSVFECNMRDGHGSADGPIFWINKSTGDIDRSIENPRYNFDLERKILERLLNARIDGQPLLNSILFNAPNLGLSGVRVFNNHNNHIHINGAGPGNARLKVISEGGNRPELSPDQLRAMWYLAYAGGDGVVNISKDMQVEVTLEQFQQLSVALETARAQQQQAPLIETPAAPSETPAAPTPEQQTPAAAPDAAAQAIPQGIDYMSVMPLQSDIPAEFIGMFKPSKHFSAIELAAQAWTESKFNPNARSGVGAQGISQFMPGTWKTWGKDDPNDPDTAASPFNPVEALDAQRRLMDQNYEDVQRLLDQGKIHGDVRQLAYAAYNAGLGNVMDYDGMPPFKETRNYVKIIDDKIEFYVKAVATEHGVQ